MDKRLRFIADLIEPLRVAPESPVRLSRDHDPGFTGKVARVQADGLLAEGVELLAEYQARCPRRRVSTTSGPAATGRSATGNAT